MQRGFVLSDKQQTARSSHEDGRMPLASLYGRPGFMIRRAHQIAVALFSEETANYGVTSTQYGVLWMLQARPHLDQISLAKLMGLDRSTTGLVVSKLEEAGLLIRRDCSDDRRKKVLALTADGRAMLARLSKPAGRVQERLLSVFSKIEAEEFLELLSKLIVSFATVVRTPILPEKDVMLSGAARAPSSTKRTGSRKGGQG